MGEGHVAETLLLSEVKADKVARSVIPRGENWAAQTTTRKKIPQQKGNNPVIC